MKMKILTLSALLTLAFTVGCGSEDQNKESKTTENETTSMEEEEEEEVVVDEGKGIGKIEQVSLTDPLEESMVTTGKAIYEMKCAACHKLSDQRVVGPGWAGITNRRRPEWIMNMITNVDVMLEKDPEAQKLLEECLTRMPNQNVSIGDARGILEYMRKNDMETVGSKDGAVKES